MLRRRVKPATARATLRAVAVLILGSLINACSGPVTWTQDKKADVSALATISCDWEQNYKVYIIKVDNQKTPGLTQTAHVTPGEHTLVVGYENDLDVGGAYGKSTSHSFQKIRFTAEAGKAYAVHRKVDGYQVVLTLEPVGRS